jgi:hypothetical protein
VVAKRVEDRFIIPLPYGESVDWFRNVRAQGGCTIVSHGQSCQVTGPQVIDSSAGLPAFPVVQRLLFRLFGIKAFLSLRCPAT